MNHFLDLNDNGHQSDESNWTGGPPHWEPNGGAGGGNPLYYVDLGEAKDVRTVVQVMRNNHAMKNPMIVASNDLVTWTVVYEQGPDTYDSSDALWVSTMNIPVTASSGSDGITPTHSYVFNSLTNTFDGTTFTFGSDSYGSEIVGNTGTVSGTVTWDANNGLGTTAPGYLSVPSFEMGGDFSIETVFKLDADGQYQRVYSFNNGSSASMIGLYRINSNVFRFEVRNVGDVNSRHDTPSNALWNPPSSFIHMICTIESSSVNQTNSLRMYINGEEVTPEHHGNVLRVVVPNITRTNHVFGKDFNDDTGEETTKYLKYYNSVLTSQQVTQLYTDYDTPTPSTNKVDLSTYDALIADGWTLNSITNIIDVNGTPLGFTGWNDNSLTIPGTSDIGTWDFTAETWWNSDLPNALCFWGYPQQEASISKTLTQSGTYHIVIGTGSIHKNTGESISNLPINSNNTVRVLLNDVEIWNLTSLNGDSSGLQYMLEFNANANDVIKVEDFGTSTVNIYGIYLPPTDITESTGQLDTSVVGDYIITYTVEDTDGNSTQATRTVQVRDTVAPQITVSGGDVTIARESTYVDAGASAFDHKSDGTQDNNTDLTSSIVATTKAKAPNGTNTWYVKVVNSGGNKYVFTADSTFTSQGYLLYPEITLTAGETYVFDQSDSSNNNHPIRFADSSGGSYSTGVAQSGTPGQAGAIVTFTVPSYGYTTMKYVCQVHGAGMGNTIYVKAASDAVNTVTAQKFQVCYDVTDAQSNAATTKYRMVTVSDNTSPSISLTGGTVTIERVIGSYSEPGYSATDGTVDLTSRVSVTHNVNTTVTGDYYYNYDVTDSSGNTATRVSRLVQVRDSRAPSISITGSSAVTVERYSTYNDAGATADDDGTSVSVSTDMGGFDKDTVGTYTITYSATDAAGNTATATRTVSVEDNNNPIVTLQSAHENPYYIEVGTGSYTEYGATATDGNGGPALSVVTTGSVNTNAVGTYYIYYTATDSTGRSGQASRQVIVRDTVAPTVSLIGNATVEIEAGSIASYVDAGVNASDASGTVNITTDHNIDVNTPGSYTFTHTVSDGTNQTQVSRTVVVISSFSEITLLGDNPMTVEAGSTWTDPGATVAGSSGTGVQSISTDGLIWKLDPSSSNSYSGSGTAWNDVISSYHATLYEGSSVSAGATFSTEAGGSLVFDGTNDWARVDSLSDFFRGRDGSFTFQTWVKATAAGQPFSTNINVERGTVLLSMHQGGNNRMRWQICNNAIFVSRPGTTNDTLHYHDTLDPDTWRLYTFVGDNTNSQLTLYIDKTEITTVPMQNVASLWSDVDRVSIGQEWDGNSPSEFFQGSMGLWLAYDRALSASQVSSNYEASKSRFGYGPAATEAGVVLPVQNGLTAHHSWFSFQDNNTWEDLTGNGNHATRQGGGTVSLVTAANANTTGFGGLGPWPYINGDYNSRWDLFGGQTLNSDYTIVYIMRYDVNASHRRRIIDMKGTNYLIGAHNGYIGKTYQGGWINYDPSMQNTEWVLGIDMPNRQVRRGTVTTQWADNTGGGSNHTNLIATINNGQNSNNANYESSDYNITEIIYYNRKFTDSEIYDMKDWLDDYAAGLVHDNYTLPDVSGAVDLSQHVYFGWAPTWTSSNGSWEPFQIKIEQNGTDIVDNETIEYLLSPGGNSSANDDSSGNHFCQYTSSQPEWHGSHTSPSYWETNQKPVLYRKTNVALDGSQLVARQSCREGHWPKHGYIVSAASASGPWIIRGGWCDQDGASGGYNDFVDSPLSMTHEWDADGWRKVTEVPRGTYINDPFSGTTQSSTIPVEVPIVAMSDVEEYGRDIEVKFVVTMNETDYAMHYKNWILKYVFDHVSNNTTPGVLEENYKPTHGFRGKDVCCARGGLNAADWATGQWKTSDRGVMFANAMWNWKFVTGALAGGTTFSYRQNGSILVTGSSMQLDQIHTGSDWGFGRASGDTNWTKIVIYARKLLSVNDFYYRNGASDPSSGHYDSGGIDLMYSQQSNHPTSWRWGNYQYQNLPTWIEAKMPLWGTSHVNMGDVVPIVFRQKTEVIMFNDAVNWSPPWNSLPQDEWTRTSDPRGTYFNQGTSNHDIYTKTFEPGSYNIDTNSAMYLFAPVYEASGGISGGGVTKHISINIYHEGEDSTKVTGSAGAIVAENWNNFTAYNGNVTMPLVDSTGADSGASLFSDYWWGTYKAWNLTTADPNDGAHGSLFRGYIDNFHNSPNGLVISNIPAEFQSQGYELRIYHNTDSAGNMGFRVEDGTGYSKTYYSYAAVSNNNYPLSGTDEFGGGAGYIGSQNESNTHTTPTNYTFFDGLSGSTLTIMGVRGGTGDTRSRPNGFQITTRSASSATSASASNPFPLVQGVSTSLVGPFTGPQTITVSRNLPKGTSLYSIEFTFTSTTTTPSSIMFVGWSTNNSTSQRVLVTTQGGALTISHYSDDHAFTGYDYTLLFDGSAHNVRITKDSGSPATVTLYVDGDAKGTGTVNGPINMGNQTELLIGNSSLGQGGSINSNHEIRNVRIMDDTETTIDLMMSTPGRYGITYSAPSGTNTSTATRTVIVNDTVSPVFGTITNVTNHQRGTTYSDSVPTAYDPRDSGNVDISSSVTTTSNTVNDSQVGTYSVTYSVSDGTNTTTATKSVTVVDSTQPVITLSGDGLTSDSRLTITPNAYSNWNQLGDAVDVTFTATDDGDDVSGLVQIDVSNVLWDTPGDYDVFYDLSDPNFGPNASRRTRYLTIEAEAASGTPEQSAGIPQQSSALVWLDAQTSFGDVAEGTQVTEWPNLADSSNNFITHTSRNNGVPTVQVDSNNKKVINFNIESLQAESTITGSQNTQGMEVWAVVTNNDVFNNTGGHYRLLIDSGMIAPHGWGLAVMQKLVDGVPKTWIQSHFPHSSGPWSNLYLDPSDEYMVIRVRYDFEGGTTTLYAEGTESTVSLPLTTFYSKIHSGTGTVLGQTSKNHLVSARSFIGTLGTMIIYDTLLTSSEATELETYLRNRWIPSGPSTSGSGVTGLTEQKYTGNYADDRDWFDANPGNKSGSSTVITNLQKNDEGSHYSYNWTGAFVPHVSGTWTFWTSSDDSSHVFIDDLETGAATHVVNNGGPHGTVERTGTITVVAGTVYGIQVTFEEYGGGASMRMDYQAPGLSRVNANLTSYNNTVFQSAVITSTSATSDSSGSSGSSSSGSSSSGSSGMTLPVTSGLLAHYSWYSWKNTTTWEDLSGNGNHMVNQSEGSSALVTAENANMTDNDTGARFPYIAGNSSSRWDMAGMTGGERMPQNSWTYIHIHRYDPAGSDKDGRVLGTVGDNVLFGTWHGYVGNSHHGNGFVGGHNYVNPRFGGHWVFHIERPGPNGPRYWRTTTKDSSWSEISGGGNANMNYRPTLNAGQYNENCDWNVAELILFNRILSNTEVESFKTWLMDYKAGNIHEQYTSSSASGGGSPPVMDWVWPSENSAVSELKDYHPRMGGGEEVVGGWNRGQYELKNAGYSGGDYVNDSIPDGLPFHSFNGYGVNGDDYIDFIFTFADANTWCSGYRQYGHANWTVNTFSKDIEIYTGDANFGPWTLVASDSHSNWHNNGNNAFTDSGTTTEWTPSAPSKYLRVKTLTNHGDGGYGGRITVRYLQLKIGVGTASTNDIVAPVNLSDGLQIEFIWSPEYRYNNEKWWPSYVHSDQQRGDNNGISNFNNGITFSTTNHDVRTDGIVLKDNGHNCTLYLNKVFQDNFKSTVGNAVSFEVWCEYTGDYTMESGFKGWMMGLDDGYGPTICINESRVGNISCLPAGNYTHTFNSSNPYQGGNIVNYQGVLMHLIGCWKWDGSGIVESIYINGEYVQPTNDTPSNPSMSANITSMHIGGRTNPSTGEGTCYGMKIYSARVWHKELDQGTVDLLYAAGKYTSALSVPRAAPNVPATGFQSNWTYNSTDGRWELGGHSASNGYIEQNSDAQGFAFKVAPYPGTPNQVPNIMIGLNSTQSSPENSYNNFDYLTYIHPGPAYGDMYKSGNSIGGFNGHPLQISGHGAGTRTASTVYQVRVNTNEYVELVKDGNVIHTFGLNGDNTQKAWEGGRTRLYVATAWWHGTNQIYDFRWVDSAGNPVGPVWTQSASAVTGNAGVVLPVQNGLTAHHSWFSFQDNDTWEDLTGNGHHAIRAAGGGTVSLVTAANANTTGFGGLGPWPYVSGDNTARWDLFGGQTLNPEYTIVYIMRYDVNAVYRRRIIDMRGRNYLIGAYEGAIGRSYHGGWLGADPLLQNTEWVMGIEMPNHQVRRGTVTTQWADNTGGGSNHTNLIATIMNGNGGDSGTDYNIAELIYYNRIFTDSEIYDMKDWLDDYAAGLIHNNYT
jgi:hypothetical protein